MTPTTMEAPVTSQYANLTLDDLRALHHQLCEEHTALYNRLMIDSTTPRVDPLGDEWKAVADQQAVINEQADGVMAEITRRELNLIDTPGRDVVAQHITSALKRHA